MSQQHQKALLHDLSVVPTSQVPLSEPMATPATMPTTRQPCEPNQEPMLFAKVDLRTIDAYHVLSILEPRPCLLRSGLRKRLSYADSLVKAHGFGLVVLDGHRTLETQQRLLDYYSAAASDEGYVAEVSDTGPRAPHTTGGAVDLTLSFRGTPLALGSDYDSFKPEAHALFFEDKPDKVTAKRLRRLMSSALSQAGLVCYDKEWWHWSYGDDVWAAATGKSAVYDVWEHEDKLKP